MTSITHGTAPVADGGRGNTLVLWSLVMLPVYAVAWVALGWLSLLLLGAIGLNEGDLLLMAHSVMGWVLTLALYAAMAAAPVVSIVLGARALHSPARRSAIVAVVLNALVLAFTLVQLASEIQLSYWPGAEPW